MAIVVLHSPQSKESRAFVAKAPGDTAVLLYEEVCALYPNISKFPAVVLDGVVSYPESWDEVVYTPKPSRAKFRDFASNSAMWAHINQHTPILASNLYTALLASSQLNEVTTISEIKTWMTLIAQTLPDGQKLDQVQSPSTLEVPGATLGEPPTVQPIGTFADELDHWLEQSYFDWRYADLC